MTKEATLIVCPNCGLSAQKEGNKVTCENCDAIYTITKTGSARVKKLGPIEDHENRIAKIEAALFPPADPEPTDPEPADPEPIEQPKNDFLE